MNPNYSDYNPNRNMPMNSPRRPNTQSFNQQQYYPTTRPEIVWEPYGIRSPRRLITNEESARDPSINIDQDWLHAYATYSPYKTSNQTYGFQPPKNEFIPNPYFNQSVYGQVPNDPRQNPMNNYVPPQGSSRASMLLNKYGLPPLAYRTTKSSENMQ